LEKVLKAHTGEVCTLTHENGKLISGGKDNKIAIYKAAGGDYTLEKTLDFDSSYPKAIDYMNGKILVGLRNGSIFEINEETNNKKQIMASHHEGEAWGLEVVPEDHAIMTIGDDNKVMVFDYASKKFIRQGKISEKSEPKNKEKAKKVTASTLSVYPVN
jgi:WD40 repeat protein